MSWDVEQVNVSKNALGADGAKALANCLKSNATITQVRRWVVWAWCQGAERRFQPCTKLFAKVAVQNLAASFIWAFVGVLCDVCVVGRCCCVHMDVHD